MLTCHYCCDESHGVKVVSGHEDDDYPLALCSECMKAESLKPYEKDLSNFVECPQCGEHNHPEEYDCINCDYLLAGEVTSPPLPDCHEECESFLTGYIQ